MNSALTELQTSTIESLESRLDQIAVLPAVIARLAALDLDSPDADGEIEALVRSDPPLALRLMRLANSALHGSADIDTIPDGAISKSRYRGSCQPRSWRFRCVGGDSCLTRAGNAILWIHSIQTALAARRLAGAAPRCGPRNGRMLPGGPASRYRTFRDLRAPGGGYGQARTKPKCLIRTSWLRLKLRVCGFDHATLGYEVCRRWNLPESVCEMVRVHHMYGADRRGVPPEVATLVRLVQEADCR